MKNSILLFLLLVSFTTFSQNTTSSSTETYFKPLKWRSLGPFRGGRSNTACGVKGDPLTYYMGTTGGGLWKTEDAGHHWRNISDGFMTTGSVGAVAVADSDPNIVFCGMGEHAPRNVMTSHGDGVYKSTDAGKTWKKVGLEKTLHIADIIIHPSNPDIVYVAAQGPLYGDSPERGLFKSTDGGETWKKILYVNTKTGCSDLSMDPTNPLILYAAMWEHGRKPWKVISGGPGSGMYKSTDGGSTWNKIEEGLPKELGKMAVSVSGANPDKVYAVVESDSDKEQGGLFVSENAGQSWTRISKDHRLVQRAWYYIEVQADPQNENLVYVLSAPTLRSIDGGKNWEVMNGTHSDYHDLWINSNNPKNMVIANDGGASITFDGGKNWSPQDNMPTAQIYRVNVDNHFPYRIYGGQQDNSSLRMSSREPGSSGITTDSWDASAGGESAFLAFDPDNPRYVLGGSYLGTIEVLDTEAKAGTNIMAAPILYLGRDAKDQKYRYNWNAPIIWSQHEPNTYYHCAQYVLRTRDMGMSWEEISPDLSRNDTTKQGKPGVPYTNEAVGAENYGTISYIVESPHEKGVMWVGTDDGLVQLTRDGGENWKNVTPAGLPECLVNAIDVSPHDPATAYIAATRYKFNDHTPMLYKTSDYGKSWTNISKGIPSNAFTRVIREDEERKGLLFAGTETGLYISWNDGKSWSSFQLNLPIVPITDLAVKHGDLIAATAGRGFWILDDLGMIRQYDGKDDAFAIYQPEDNVLANGRSELDRNSASFDGTHPTRGVNPANGIVLYYQLPDDKNGADLLLEIKDADGQLVRRFTSAKDTSFKAWDGGPPAEPMLSKSKGLNRFVWDMRYPTLPGVPGVYIEGSYKGHKASPGTYTAVLKQGDREASTTFSILSNPLYPTDARTYAEYHNLMTSMEAVLTDMHLMVNRLADIRKQVADVVHRLPDGEAHQAARKEGKALLKQLTDWDAEMVQRKTQAYDDVENFRNKLTAEYLFLINQAESDIPKVTKPVLALRKEYEEHWGTYEEQAKALLHEAVPSFNKTLHQAGVGVITVTSEEE